MPEFAGINLRPQQFIGHTDCIERIAWSPDGERIASSSLDLTCRVWDVKTGNSLHEFRGHTDKFEKGMLFPGVFTARFTPDGNFLLSAGSDATVRVWPVNANSPKRVISIHQSAVGQLLVFSDGLRVVSGDFSHRIKIWSLHNQETLFEFQDDVLPTDFVLLPGEEKLLISSYSPNVLKVWNYRSGDVRLLDNLELQNEPVYALAVSPDGNTLVWAVEGDDNAIRVGHLNTATLSHTLVGHTDSVTSLDFSADGRLLASKSEDGSVRLWRTDTWKSLEPLAEPWPGNGIFPGLAFHPSRPVLATLGENNTTIRVWDLDYNAIFGSSDPSYISRPRLPRRKRTVVRVFVGSPGDVLDERRRLQRVVDSLNRREAADRDLFVELVQWQTSSTPEMGIPQDVILKQLPPENWDVFIGILWTRFGTESGIRDPETGEEYLSGTEAEFKAAYNIWNAMGKKWPKIMIYRCFRSPQSLRDLDHLQFLRVGEFFSEFVPKGQHPGLVREYDQVEDFERFVREHLIYRLDEFNRDFGV